MAKSASVIEINGSRYDAVTGQLMGAVKRVTAQVKKPAVGVIDGLVRKPETSTASVLQARAPTRKRLRDNSNYEPPTARRQTQHSRTLMRSAVSRPKAIDKKADSAAKLHKGRVSIISPKRANRAKTIIKNARVNHFGKPGIFTPAIRSKQSRPANQAVAQHSAQSVSTRAVARPLPSMITSLSHQHLERLLDRALLQADAHKQALKDRAKGWRRVTTAPKWLSLGASSLVLFVIGGFFAWQDIPQVSMRIAATRAHVSAVVPAYTPTGFGFAGPVTASANKVTIGYTSTTGNQQSYAITEESSNYDSSSVQANAVPTGSQVQTSQINGTTVYIYGSTNDAKWVNHGVLFTLQDKANLSSDEILKIANSL